MTNIKIHKIILISSLSSVMLILIQMLRWSLIETITPFLEPVIEVVLYGFFLATFIWAIIYFIKNGKSIGKCAIIPFLIHVITLIIVCLVPFTTILINLDFSFNYADRQKIISLVESDNLKIDSSKGNSLVELPSKYKHLSSGGEIIVERNSSSTSILFYTYRGVLENFSGFIYSSDSGFLQEEKFNSDYKQIIKFREHWFWVSSS